MTQPTPQALALPAPVRAFVERHQIPDECIRAGGSLRVVLDGKYRVHMTPGPHDRLVFRSDLKYLASPPQSNEDEFLFSLAQSAAGTLKSHASTLCIDDDRQVLALEQCLPAGSSSDEFDRSLGEFVDTLAFWTELVAKLAPAAERIQ